MRIYGENWLKVSVAQKLRVSAWESTFDGRMTLGASYYLDACTAFHSSSGSVLLFTRDTGHHTSGWFKNPDYERCWHLSLSFREPFNHRKQAEYNEAVAEEWVELFFGEARRFAWRESAKTVEGRQLEVCHWRVFCDENWQPILPRGEVYSTELTERGWKSWSELHPDSPVKEPSILHAG